MDKKEQQLVNYYYNKFQARTFDEKDLYAFFMVVQKQANDHKELHDLIDFLIYRDKCTGAVKEYFAECQEIINNLGKTKVRRKIEPLFSFKDIRNGFNALFQQLGFDKLPVETINDFLLCIISLLQGIKIVSSRSNQKVGHLSFAASSKELFLMGNLMIRNEGRRMPITFPVLSVKNSYEEITPQDQNDTPYLFDNEIMEVINVDKKLTITFPTIKAE